MSRLTRNLCPDLKKKAQEELGENEETLDEDIQRLRMKVLEVKELRSRTDDAFLLRFLRAKKFDQVRALDTIKNYYKQRQKYPQIFQNLTAAENSKVLTANIFTANSNDKELRVAISVKASNWDPSEVTFDEHTIYVLLSLERILEEPDSQINGVVFVFDLKGLNLSQVLGVTPFALARFASVIVNSLPVRIKRVHIVNESKLFDIIFALAKPLLSKKLRSRFIFHGGKLESLYEHISPNELPEELGGTSGPFSNTDWNKELLDHDEVMISDKEYGFKS